MKSLEESVVTAMDGSDIELFNFLPYILQDAWEIGADPEVIINLISKHFNNYSQLKILDLGCGKGAVAIKIAQKFKCYCHGIDAIKEFINDAKNKAIEYQVDQLCNFEVNDIRVRVNTLSSYDIIVLGAIGPVLGNFYSTLTTLSKCLTIGGALIIDDGYIENNIDFSHPLILKQEEVLQQIKKSGMCLVDEKIIPNGDIKDTDDFIFDNLKKRCLELIKMHPHKQKLFYDYIKKQEKENDVLENKIVCSTMVIKRYP